MIPNFDWNWSWLGVAWLQVWKTTRANRESERREENKFTVLAFWIVIFVQIAHKHLRIINLTENTFRPIKKKIKLSLFMELIRIYLAITQNTIPTVDNLWNIFISPVPNLSRSALLLHLSVVLYVPTQQFHLAVTRPIPLSLLSGSLFSHIFLVQSLTSCQLQPASRGLQLTLLLRTRNCTQ